MAGSKGMLLVVAGAIVAILAMVAGGLGLYLRGDNDRLAPGSPTFDSMRIVGLRTWVDIKDMGDRAPETWTGTTEPARTDEWGRVFRVRIDKTAVGDSPTSLFGTREPAMPTDMMVWLIQVSSMGPDGEPETADDILFWRMNSADDGMVVDQGLVCDEEIWAEFLAQYRDDVESWTGQMKDW